MGKRHQPFYKIVVTDKENPPQGGRFKEQVGYLNPINKEKSLDEERINYWLSVGAQPSGRIHNLLIKEGILQGEKKDVRPRESVKPTVEEASSEEETPAQKKAEEQKKEKGGEKQEAEDKETNVEKKTEDEKDDSGNEKLGAEKEK